MFGLVAAAGDTAVKLSAWQLVYGSTWSPQEYADYNTWKHLVCAIGAITPTVGLTVPFENARRAYYADKTWPLELRRGYTSPTQALLRIPYEEGIGYLFRGGVPIYANQWMFWVTYLSFYTWFKNKMFFMWVYNEFNYEVLKVVHISTSFLIAGFHYYPFYYAREMVDLWPKERGGHCTFNNNYRQAMKWQIENMDVLFFNFQTNFMQWVRRYGLLYIGGLWVADSMGMMSNCNETFNGLEVQFPIFSEST